jgi:hypothetical protein
MRNVDAPVSAVRLFDGFEETKKAAAVMRKLLKVMPDVRTDDRTNKPRPPKA